MAATGAGEPPTDAVKETDSVDEDDPWAMFKDVTHALPVEQIKQRYIDIGIISQNRNCTVRLSIHERTGQKVVMKILNKDMFSDQTKRLLLYREIQTLRLLGDEKHITELYEVIDSGDRIWVVMEYAAGGELFDFVKAKAPLVDSQAREIFRPIAKVVAFMHSQNLVHRDLKLENVLLSTAGKIMLADFGFSRYWDPKDGFVKSLCGTPHYCPPEIVKAQPYNPMYADSWSLGVILFMLFYGRFPFTGLSIPEMQKRIVEAKLVLPFPLSDLAEDLLKRLITVNPTDRLLASEILQHPWYNKNKLPSMKKKRGDDKLLIHKAVLGDLGIKDNIAIDQIDKLDEDTQVAYRIVRRRYQLHELELMTKPDHGALNIPQMDFKPLSGRTQAEQVVNVEKRSSNFVMGMKTERVNERLPSLDPFLRVSRVDVRAKPRPKTAMRPPRTTELLSRNAIRKRRRDQNRADARTVATPSALAFRARQTLRLKSCTQTPDDPQLPRMNCQKTTLDPLPDLWRRLITFIEKEKISVITEKDWGLQLLVCDPANQDELCVVLNVGCVHPGFGLIGYSVYKMRGDEDDFRQFEAKLNEYMGFL